MPELMMVGDVAVLRHSAASDDEVVRIYQPSDRVTIGYDVDDEPVKISVVGHKANLISSVVHAAFMTSTEAPGLDNDLLDAVNRIME